MKKIILVDINWGAGHVPTYHKQFIKALLDLGYQVVSITPNPTEVSKWVSDNLRDSQDKVEYVSFLSSTLEDSSRHTSLTKDTGLRAYLIVFLKRLKVKEVIKEVYSFFYGIRLWKDTSSVIRSYLSENNSISSVKVFFPFLDDRFMNKYLSPKMIDSVFPYPWAGLYLHPTHIRLNKRKVLRPDSILFSKNCKAVAVLDEEIMEKFQKNIRKHVVRFPDITDDTNDPLTGLCEDILRLANGRKILTLVGSNSKRKNLTSILKVAEASKKQNLPYFFVIAGAININTWNAKDQKYIQSFYNTKNANTFFHLKKINDGAEYNSFVKISDILFAFYHSFYHSSNTLTKAAIFEKFTIVGEGYLMAERVLKYQTGLSVQEKNIGQIMKAIDCLLRKVNYNEVKLAPRFKEYEEMHSLKYLNTAFTEVLNSYSDEDALIDNPGSKRKIQISTKEPVIHELRES